MSELILSVACAILGWFSDEMSDLCYWLVVVLLPVLYSWDVPGTPSPGSQDVPPEDLQDPPDLPEGLQDRRSRPGSVGLGLAGES